MTFLLFVLENKLQKPESVGSPRAFPGLTFTLILFPSLLSFAFLPWGLALEGPAGGPGPQPQLPCHSCLYLAQHLLLTKSFMVLYPWYELQEKEAEIKTTLWRFPERDTVQAHTFFFHSLRAEPPCEPQSGLHRQQAGVSGAQVSPGSGSPGARMWKLPDRGF